MTALKMAPCLATMSLRNEQRAVIDFLTAENVPLIGIDRRMKIEGT
jgi:hypothetical protein